MPLVKSQLGSQVEGQFMNAVELADGEVGGQPYYWFRKDVQPFENKEVTGSLTCLENFCPASTDTHVHNQRPSDSCLLTTSLLY
jgi:hypothetical protein